jgi:Fic family protein
MTQLNPNQLIWQRPEWPYFQWDSSALLESLVKLRHQQGRLIALAPFIENEGPLSETQKDIAQNFKAALTKERLFGWQASLFPNGYSGMQKLTFGEYRKKDFTLNPSSSVPLAKSLNEEMKRFLTWWNDSPVGLDGIIRAGIAYFWFITLQPFEGGNEQIGQALIALALAQDENAGRRPYDIGQAFLNGSEETIEHCQKLNGDITKWLQWLFEKLGALMNETQLIANKEAEKIHFLNKTDSLNLNFRQKKIIKYFLSGKISFTNRDCVKLCQTSRESIKRDLAQLVKLGLIKQSKSGRSVEYNISRV